MGRGGWEWTGFTGLTGWRWTRWTEWTGGMQGARWGELCYNAPDPQTHRQEETTTVRRVLSFDPGSCTGCLSCMLNCALQHEGLNALSSARLAIEFDPFEPQWPAIYCRQCTRAPCAAACPVEAIRRHPSKEYWYIDYDACTGCRACVEAWPVRGVPLRPADRQGAEVHHVRGGPGLRAVVRGRRAALARRAGSDAGCEDHGVELGTGTRPYATTETGL